MTLNRNGNHNTDTVQHHSFPATDIDKHQIETVLELDLSLLSMEIDTGQAATALLTEHLQYTPLSLIDDIIDSVNNFVYQGVGSLETGLFATPPERLGFKSAPPLTSDGEHTEPDYPEAKQEIEEGLHKLETLLNSTVDKNFDKFEIYVLRNILSVPQELAKWIRLSHYEGIHYPLPADAPTVENVHLLRRKLAASRNVNRALQREQRRNEAVLAQLRSMTKLSSESSDSPNLAFLLNDQSEQSLASQARQSLTTTTTFTLSQLPALKTILVELRSKMETLRQIPVITDTAKDERREERREYIEQRTRSHLERSGQSIADDVGAVGGRNIDTGELESLEKMASIFQST